MPELACSVCRAYFSVAAGEQGFVFCLNCGVPHFAGDASSPFVALSAPLAFKLDEKALEGKYFELSKRLHPDRFASVGPAARLRSQEMAAQLNKAYLSLRQPEARLEALLRSAGELKDVQKSASANQGKIPAELAEEFFEIQEAAIEEPAKARGMIASLSARLVEDKNRFTQEMYELAGKLDWAQPQLPESKAAIGEILELRRSRSYVRSMLENLERLGTAHE